MIRRGTDRHLRVRNTRWIQKILEWLTHQLNSVGLGQTDKELALALFQIGLSEALKDFLWRLSGPGKLKGSWTLEKPKSNFFVKSDCQREIHEY